MKTVKQILDAKGREVWTIQPEASVFEAIQLMAEKKVGALVVADGDKPVGIISERDYARKVILKGKSSQETPIRDIMTTDVVCTRLDQTVEECMALVTEKRIRHLPVLDGEQLVGIISIGDLVKTIIAEQQFMIEQLEHYITR
jgi:CBS domain-containing protein